MRHPVVALALCTLAACGGGTTDPHPPQGALALVVLPQTDQQTGPAGGELPRAVEVVAGRERGTARAVVVAYRAGDPGGDTLVTNLTPIVGAIVNFVVPDPACGRPFAGSALTDASGHAKERWLLGTTARACVMEARLVDQTTGAALVVDEITATVGPGPAASLALAPSAGTTQQTAIPLASGAALDLASWSPAARDTYGNAIPAPAWEHAVVAGLDPLPGTWTAGAVATAPSGAGVYRLHLRVAGTQVSNFRWIAVP